MQDIRELAEDQMNDLAAELAERGYPHGTSELAQDARTWIATLVDAEQAGNLTEQDVKALTDRQALFVVARTHGGGLGDFLTWGGYPPASSTSSRF